MSLHRVLSAKCSTVAPYMRESPITFSRLLLWLRHQLIIRFTFAVFVPVMVMVDGG